MRKLHDREANTFKTNPSLERGIMTGITGVSKEFIFSDLNNLNVVRVIRGLPPRRLPVGKVRTKTRLKRLID